MTSIKLLSIFLMIMCRKKEQCQQADLRCIQCHVIYIKLGTPKISCQTGSLFLRILVIFLLPLSSIFCMMGISCLDPLPLLVRK